MIFIRNAITSLVLVFLAIFIYFFFVFDTEQQLSEAFDSYLQEEYEESLSTLSAMEKELKPHELSLYRAYIAHAQEEFEDSKQLLDLALDQAKKNLASEHFLQELYLFQALLLYDLRQEDAFSHSLSLIHKNLAYQDLLSFFQALDFYSQGDYQESLDLWKNWSFSKLEHSENFPSLWYAHAFFHSFSKEKFLLQQSHAEIEEGNILAGRQKIEQMIDSLEGALQVEANFLLGLSYYKEASGKSALAAMPYYQVGLSYFKQVPFQNSLFSKQKQALFLQIQEASLSFLQQEEWEQANFFISVLERWEARQELRFISRNLIKKFQEKQVSSDPLALKNFTRDLLQHLRSMEVRLELALFMEERIEKLFEMKQWDKIPVLWEVLEDIHPNLSRFQNQMTASMHALIFENLEQSLPLWKHKDKQENSSALKENMDQIKTELALWNLMEDREDKQIFFIKQLLVLSLKDWMGQEHLQRAPYILSLIHELSHLSIQEKVYGLVQEQLKKVYHFAAKRDDLDKMTMLYVSAKLFELSSFGEEEKAEIANQLEDALYLIKAGRVLEAEKRLVWITQIQKEHLSARKHLGTLYYGKKEYAKAAAEFAQLPKPDMEVQEMKALSMLMQGFAKMQEEGELFSLDSFTEDSQLGQAFQALLNLSEQTALSDFAYMQLGGIFLLEKNLDKAKTYLSYIRRPSAQAHIYGMLLSWLMQDSAKLLDHFASIPLELKKDFNLQFMALGALARLDKESELEEIVLQMQNSAGRSLKYKELLLSQNINKYISFTSKNEALAQFFMSQGEYEQAHRYLNLFAKNLEEKTEKAFSQESKAKTLQELSQVHYTQALCLYHLGEYAQAELFLIDMKAPLSKDLLVKKQSLQAALLWKKGDFLSASHFFSKVDLESIPQEFLDSYYKSLAKSRLPRKALQVLVHVEKQRELSFLEQLMKLDLAYTVASMPFQEEAKRSLYAMDWLSSLQSLQVLSQAHLWTMEERKQWSQKIAWDSLGRSPLEKLALAKFYYKQGKFESAEQFLLSFLSLDAYFLMKPVGAELEEIKDISSLEEIIHLADLHGSHELVKACAYQALQSNPYDEKYLHILSQMETDLSSLDRLQDHYKVFLEDDASNISLRLRSLYLSLIQLKNMQGSVEEIKKREAEIENRLKELPSWVRSSVFAQWLEGSLALWKGFFKKAEASFQACLDLDPSFEAAQRMLAQSYERQDMFAQASLEYAKILARQENQLGTLFAYTRSLFYSKQWDPLKKTLQELSKILPNWHHSREKVQNILEQMPRNFSKEFTEEGLSEDIAIFLRDLDDLGAVK